MPVYAMHRDPTFGSEVPERVSRTGVAHVPPPADPRRCDPRCLPGSYRVWHCSHRAEARRVDRHHGRNGL